MLHSVKTIGNEYEQLSIMRNDKHQFNANDFIKFVNDNKIKYNIITNGDDLFVNTWYSDSLIKDYRSTILIK